MNKFIKYLFETVDDNDFFSDLGYDVDKEITFLVDDTLIPKNFYQFDKNEEYPIGTLLWIFEDTDFYVSSNEYKDINTGLELIGVNIGYDKWVYLKWKGMVKQLLWAPSGSLLYKKEIKNKKDGIIQTNYILNVIKDDYFSYEKTIWNEINNVNSNNIFKVYIPTHNELHLLYTQCETNNDLQKTLKLYDTFYYSCYYNKNGLVYSLNFNDGYLHSNKEYSELFSLAYIYFKK